MNNIVSFKYLIKELKLIDDNIELFNTQIDPITFVMNDKKYLGAGWIDTNTLEPVDDEDATNKTAPFVIASFDIECYSYNHEFPDPCDPRNKIITIATSFQRFGEKVPFLNHCASLGRVTKTESLSNTFVECFEIAF